MTFDFLKANTPKTRPKLQSKQGLSWASGNFLLCLRCGSLAPEISSPSRGFTESPQVDCNEQRQPMEVGFFRILEAEVFKT